MVIFEFKLFRFSFFFLKINLFKLKKKFYFKNNDLNEP